MKYFSLFSGVEGFGLGIENALDSTNGSENGEIKEDKTENAEIGSRLESATRQSSRNTQRRTSKHNQHDTNSREFNCVGFSEIDKYASQVLKYHYPKVKNYGDISKIDWNTVPNFDLLTGGSPCQDFSIAGKRAGIEGARSGLVWEYIRCLEEKKPKYFIWENVKGVLSSRRGFDFANILTAFFEVGYSLWWQVLNAKDFGVSQNRERIFVVGFRDGSPREVFFERETDGKNLIQVGNIDQKGHNSISGRVYSPNGTSSTLNSRGGGLGAKTGLYFTNEADLLEK